MKINKNNLVQFQFGALRTYNRYFTHCITHNPVPLCQHKLGMKRNPTSNYLFRKYIL